MESYRSHYSKDVNTINYGKIITVDELSDANYKVISLGLLFSVNIVLIIMTMVFIVFYIEFKDEILEK